MSNTCVRRKMTSSEQLVEWVNGNPIHNAARDECCPDFSCCTGRIAPVDERERFAKAFFDGDEEVQLSMLMMFLGAAFSEENIYIAGDKAVENQVQ